MAGRSRLDKARGIRIVDSKSCGMNATDSKENGVEPPGEFVEWAEERYRRVLYGEKL